MGPLGRRFLVSSLLVAAALGTVSHAVSGFDGRVAAEILRLWPDWPAARVEIPLNVFREYVRLQKPGTQDLPPVTYLLEHQLHKLTIDEKSAGLEVTVRAVVFDPEQAGQIALFHRSVPFRDMAVDGKPEKLAPIGDWLCWQAPKPGTYTITASASLKPGEEGASATILYPRAASVRTELAVASAQAWEVTSPDGVGKVTGTADGTKGGLALKPGASIRASWCKPLPAAEHEPTLSTTCTAACDFAPGVIAVNAQLDVIIRRGKTDRLTLELPANADRISADGPDVRQVDGRVVHLRRPVLGRTRLNLRFEIPRPGAKGKATLDYFGLAGAVNTGGYLIVSNSAGGELLEDEAARLEETAFFGLPEEVLTLSTEKPLLAYAMQRGRWRLDCDIVLPSEVPMPPTLVDRATHVIVCRADGNIIGKVKFDVCNRDRQFLIVRVPEGTSVLAAIVDDQSVAVTSLAPGEFALPLRRSITAVTGLVSFPVELVYTRRAPGLGRSGEFELPLPKVDAPIAYATCTLFLPEEYRFTKWRGPLAPAAGADKQPAEARTSRADAVADVDETRVCFVQFTPTDASDAGSSQSAPSAPNQDGTLAESYYREGVNAYEGKDLAEAKEMLEKVVENAPADSAVAENARKMLGNIDALAGEGAAQKKDAPRATRAQAQQVAKEVQADADQFSIEQRNLLRKADEFVKQGDVQAAAEAYGGAVVLGEELNKRGRGDKDQEAVTGYARQRLAEQLAGQKKVVEAQRGALNLKYQIQAQRTGQKAAQQAQAQAEQQPEQQQQLQELLSEGQASGSDDLTNLQRQLDEQEKVIDALNNLIAERKDAKVQGGRQDILLRARRAAEKPGSAGGAKAPQADVKELGELRQQLGQERELLAQELNKLQKKLPNLTAVSNVDLPNVPGEWKDIQDQRPVASPEETEWRQKLNSVLDERISFDFISTPLDDVVAFLRQMKRVSIVVDKMAFRDRGNLEVTLKVDSVKFRDALDMTCGLIGLGYTLEEGAIYITTREKLRALQTAQTVYYDPEEWKPLEAVMDGRVSFDFVSTPFNGVLAFLSRMQNINIVVDPAAAGLASPDVTMKVENMKFKYALAWVCRRQGLGYTIRNGAIFISTPGDRLLPQGRAVTRFYDVTELTVDVNSNTVDREKQRQLIDLVKNTLDARNQAEPQGLNASSAGTVAYQDGKLAVTHNTAFQEQVENLLDNARKNWGQKVNVRSFNTIFPERLAPQAGIEWTRGNNGVNYAVADEGRVRALVALSQRQNRAASFSENLMNNGTVVGTNTAIANRKEVNVKASDIGGNRFDYDNNDVYVPHNRYLLVSNGEYITVVSATEMYNWAERIGAKGAVDAAPRIDLPLVGQAVTFEKTLIVPEDVPVLRADYTLMERRTAE